MIEARKLNKSYRMGEVRVEALKEVSLKIDSATFMVITGPSGAGKSTLLHLLAGLDTPTHGDVVWGNRIVSRMSDTERTRFRKRMIGVVFQFYHLLAELSALENVMLAGLVNGASQNRALRRQAEVCLEHVALSSRMSHRPAELSGGEQQRVAIARALINKPQMLLCDEPTGNLDSETGQAITELLVDLYKRQKTCVMLATHDASFGKFAERTVMLRDGCIVEDSL